jgi:2,3-bisphosphoglycerate-independent phosphoglycerate mutase
MRVLLLFVDGVGVGRRDASINPLARADHALSQFQDGTSGSRFQLSRSQVDACLSVPGRPQSASNQASLYTGHNIPLAVGKHCLGFPPPSVAALIETHSIFGRMVARGKTVRPFNAFPREVAEHFSQSGVSPAPARWLKRVRPSASVLALLAANLRLPTFDDVRQGMALPHDLSGERAQSLGFEMPTFSARQAAEVIWRAPFDCGLFEYFLTDDAGHAQSFEQAHRYLKRFDDFLSEVLRQKPADAQVLVTSDHGNIEDLSTRNHTLNAVPVLYSGPAALPEINSLDEVGRTIEQWACQ